MAHPSNRKKTVKLNRWEQPAKKPQAEGEGWYPPSGNVDMAASGQMAWRGWSELDMNEAKQRSRQKMKTVGALAYWFLMEKKGGESSFTNV